MKSLAFVLLSLLFTSSTVAAKPANEKDKIESLISTVESMKDVVFIRNGSEYGPKEAAALMRHKWKQQEKKIKTAQDFIRFAATKSEHSGKPYLIRFKDGKEVESGKFLMEALGSLTK